MAPFNNPLTPRLLFLPSLLLSSLIFYLSCLFLSLFATAMKFIKSINPKNLFQSKKAGSSRISKSETVSSSSSSSSDASYTDACKTRRSTPTSVLHAPEKFRSQEIAPRTVGVYWSDASARGDGDVWFNHVEAFKLIDHDGDGKIAKCDLQMVLSRIGAAPPSEEELKTMLAEIDLDGDGCISLEEFGAIRSAFGPASGTEELKETFEVFDADHDGRISAEELLSVFSAIGDERCTLDDCKRMVASVDVDGDGFVCFEEFKRMMEQQQLSC